MPYFMVQVSYSQPSIKAMTDNPQDRAASVRKMVEAAGGKLHAWFYCFGEYDVVLIEEWADMTSAAALALAVGASGSVSRIVTTPLLTPQEGFEAMKGATRIGYSKPQ